MTIPSTREIDRARRLMAMGEMAASMAHEIRNPLGSMELYCTLLKKDLDSQPQCLTLAEQIHEGIRTVDRIISNCLQFARDPMPQRKPIADFEAFLQSVVSHAAAKNEELNVEIRIGHEGDCEIAVDQYQVRQALLNVLVNAIEAAAENNRNEPPVVALFSSGSADSWKVTVTDNGSGVDSDAAARIFDPFYTTKSGGTGLGLAITHSIVTSHGGQISFESTPGCGSVVTLLFPVQSDPTGEQ